MIGLRKTTLVCLSQRILKHQFANSRQPLRSGKTAADFSQASGSTNSHLASEMQTHSPRCFGFGAYSISPTI